MYKPVTGLYDMASKQEVSSKVQSNEALKLYSVVCVSMLASTFDDSPRRVAPNSTLTKEFRESPLEPFCKSIIWSKTYHSLISDYKIIYYLYKYSKYMHLFLLVLSMELTRSWVFVSRFLFSLIYSNTVCIFFNFWKII